MNKAHFLYLLVSFILFSCHKKEDNLPRKAIGNINTISVIIDDQLWNGEIGESIRSKFASPIIGLPQEEPLFTINQYPAKLLEGFMTDSRTIIVVKKGLKTFFEIKKNQYAAPQNVFHISGKTNGEILEIIEKNAAHIIQIIKETELTENQRIINQSLLNTKRITNAFHINLNVPKGYLYALEKQNFIWLKKEIISGNSSVLIYQVPINSIKNTENLIANIIKTRDSIGKLYIFGTEPGSHLVTEEGYSPYLFKMQLDGKQTYEIRGTWELKNDFMSGPFVNYAIVDQKNKRVLILEGFCYSPSKEKRDSMHELESIIKSIKIL
ncbi:DUF4837 family protein [Flavobacterium nackdongense]|uniref:DUF4837 family protein n=1 Tax=Flavobacterium nackdongense TaxID=2547394 RepID=A0A4P6YAQ4_9FLAO|nr:DUF4837 family protein [Flavobacterium nackdongense]QBN19218.1 DUF4837 family protein [Flavobacterium nackdongense]